MRGMKFAVAAAAAIASSAALAQYQVYWPTPIGTEVARQSYNFPMGTPLALMTRTQVNTKVNKPGDRVYFEVAEALTFRGQIVVPVGAMAVGEIVRADHNGHVGKKGKIEIRPLYVETPHGPVRLTGRSYSEGKSGTALSVATMALVSTVGGYFIHGTSGTIQAGTPVQAYLAESLIFSQTTQRPNAVYPMSVQADAAGKATPGFSK